MFVGVMVMGKLSTVANTFNLAESPTTNAINSTMWSTLYNNTYSSFNLILIIPLVAGACALVAILIYAVTKTLPNEDKDPISI